MTNEGSVGKFALRRAANARRSGWETVNDDQTQHNRRKAMPKVRALAISGVFAGFASVIMAGAAFADPVTATPGGNVNLVLLPKFLGILPFDQAHRGAEEAQKELQNKGTLTYEGPTPENSVAGQIEMMTNAATQKQNVVMLSNNAGDQIAAAAEAAQKAGTKVVTWDSPIPSGKGETVFVSQVDFGSIGVVMADMAYSLMGGSGEFAILSATPDAANQNAWIAAMKEALKGDKYKNLKLVDTVYGDDQSE
jgi:rhamnose transport system substrate-binding protein